jgi:hypothetical protein
LHLIDQLDRQILTVINKAASIVRSVTITEIEHGVLSPSVTTLDIKRNLPYNVSFNIIEGRLKALENDGYIYYELNRWWLTPKGRAILGSTGSKPSVTSSPKPIRTMLDETFSRFESRIQLSKPQFSDDDVWDKQIQAEALLYELERSFKAGIISEEELKEFTERINKNKDTLKTNEFTINKRRSYLQREIEDLEGRLVKKRIEIEELDKDI